MSICCRRCFKGQATVLLSHEDVGDADMLLVVDAENPLVERPMMQMIAPFPGRGRGGRSPAPCCLCRRTGRGYVGSSVPSVLPNDPIRLVRMVKKVGQLERKANGPRPHPARPDGESGCPANWIALDNRSTCFTIRTSRMGSCLTSFVAFGRSTCFTIRASRMGSK